jgi:hypothetical protein
VAVRRHILSISAKFLEGGEVLKSSLRNEVEKNEETNLQHLPSALKITFSKDC